MYTIKGSIEVGDHGKKRTYKRLFVLPNLYVRSYVHMYVLPNWYVLSYVRLSVLPNLYVCTYVHFFVFIKASKSILTTLSYTTDTILLGWHKPLDHSLV